MSEEDGEVRGRENIRYKKRIDMRLRIYHETISRNDEPQQQPAKLCICDAGENDEDTISLTASGGILNLGEYASMEGEIERWLQSAESTTPSTWNNVTGVETLPDVLIEVHIQQPQQRRMRRSCKRHIGGTSYRVKITLTGLVTIIHIHLILY
ncbi:unnamed protein product [Ceratitis capitata]|uniref:(Mediterranean fruit fly) hypothetical protein n=1 Tax=Ceratitis capitata TaxID=7213 RepID=A0A811V7S9_CERCA|nr:unnamed protein product [Ceratitis capitata]